MRHKGSLTWPAAVVAALALPLGAGASPGPTMIVDSSADTVAVDGQCTLREAMQNHNAKSQVNPDCPKGKVKDRIAFSFGGTILLGSELPVVQNTLTIDGGFSIFVDGSSSFRIMELGDHANLTLRGINVRFGNAVGNGGGVLNPNGNLLLDNAGLAFNNASGIGGGVYSEGSTTVRGGAFNQNTAPIAGALGGLDISVDGTGFFNNHASQFGGAIYTFGLTMTDSLLEFNTAGIGAGGLATGGQGKITGTTIAANTAPQGAGVLIQQAGGTHFLLDSDTIQGNQATCPGGGMIVQNADSESSVLITKSTISGNSTSSGACGRGGGGLVLVGPGPVTVANSTIANNTSASSHGGGIDNAGTLTLLNVTVSGNSVSGGAGTGGLQDDTGTPGGGPGVSTLGNTIVAKNSDGDDSDCGGGGAFTSLGHNIDFDGSCNLNAVGDQPSTDPQLGPLANNGGPTQTMMPGSASPALDAADHHICKRKPVGKKDQRGVKRPQGAGCDIGAVEREPF